MTIAPELLAMAITLSGLPPVAFESMPPLYSVSAAEMSATVCPNQPAQCRSMAALFDTERYRILILSTLNMQDAEENSFLLHELVHVLQFAQQGEAGFDGCEAIVASEHLAYQVQNRYLAARGLFAQQGMMMRYMRCPPDGGGAPEMTPTAIPGQPG